MTYDDYKRRFEFDPDTDELGEGGFGRVFRAWDDERKEDVALKLAKVRPDQEAFSLLQEYERVRYLRHGNIAIYLDCQRLLFPGLGRYDVAWMKYYQAGHLGQLLARQRLTADQKAGLLTGIFDGLEYLHTREPFIIHRDLKPGNVLIVERAGRYHPLITDFGISRQGLGNGYSHITNSIKAFSLYFAAPEQAEASELRPNADLWSFGVLVAYVWLDGQLPFRTQDLNLETATGQQQLQQRIRNLDLLAGVWARLPEPWQAVAVACLVVDPAIRVRSCQQVRALLVPTPPGEVAAQPAPAPSPGPSTKILLEQLAVPLSTNTKKLTEPGTVLMVKPPPVSLGGNRLRKVWYTVGTLLVALTGWWQFRHWSGQRAYTQALVAEHIGNLAQAQVLFQDAADKGCAMGMAKLGEYFLRGITKPIDTVQARQWSQRAAALGSMAGMHNLGDLFRNVMLESADSAETCRAQKKALAWYLQAAATGDSTGFYNAGRLFDNSSGKFDDFTKSWALFQRAATLGGSVNAMVALGDFYNNGITSKPDTAQRNSWYREARVYYQTHPTALDSKALHAVGILYAYSLVPHDTADSWFRKVYSRLQQSVGQYDTEEMCHLGALYENGWGVAQDYAQARNWYLKAAEQGNPTAMLFLSSLYHDGSGVEKDYLQAQAWQRKAIGKGSASAMWALGDAYETGSEMAKDYAQAKSLYEKAAHLGNTLAMVSLGNLYQRGWGVAQNYAQAREWYRKAVAKGSYDAEQHLQEL